MKKNFLILAGLFCVLNVEAQTSIFNELLQKHVSNDGLVDYNAFKNDEQKLDSYLTYLEKTNPNDSWSDNKKRAFWINAYNAYTIKLILENYPLKSILDIKKDNNTAWKIPFAKVGGQTYTLDHIEHEILRKTLFDPKIHVGVNCASISCPKLGNKAFTEENIEEELTQLMRTFVNDKTRNQLNEKKILISEIFNWFKTDFTKNSSLIDFLNQYSTIKINQKANIQFMEYDWNINKQ